MLPHRYLSQHIHVYRKYGFWLVTIQICSSLHKQVSAYSTENIKKSTSKVYNTFREKAPKTLSDNSYAVAYWSLLQDLIARLTEQNAAWISNGGDFQAVALPPLLSARLLLRCLESDPSVLNNRIEYSSLFSYLVRILRIRLSVVCECFC